MLRVWELRVEWGNWAVGLDFWEKWWRATAVQDAGARRESRGQREASWSAPSLWSFGRRETRNGGWLNLRNGARVCDPQRLDWQGDGLRLTEPRSEVRTLPVSRRVCFGAARAVWVKNRGANA
jgi:hypothetical protein